MLTTDQTNVFTNVKKFIRNKDERVFVIKGSAGVGKSFLTKLIADYIVQDYISLIAIAPTHKARRILNKFLNKERLISIPTITIASILGKLRENSYVGTHRYSNGSKQKMDMYKCFILDEVSMVSDKDLNSIVEYVFNTKKKLILIGDDCQIPSPSQQLVKTKLFCYKPDSIAFSVDNVHTMTQIVRQNADSPIIKLATYLRDNIMIENSLDDIFLKSDIDKSEICVSYDDFYDEFKTDWNKDKSTRIIAYTNAAVKTHNRAIRNLFDRTDPYVIGELITGYANVGFPMIVIENGTDYQIVSIKKTSDYCIDEFDGLTGYIINLQDTEFINNISTNLFFIDVNNISNLNFMRELVARAKKVNSKYSTKDNYRKYCALKNLAIFIEDIYEYNGDIMTEMNFKQIHQLLYTKVSDIINDIDRKKIKSELTKKIEDLYGNIINKRIDDNKPLSDGEILADQFMIVEKDVFYGYAITAHKSQGSTYLNAYVDNNDFYKISNRWNYKFRMIENRYKERNQLLYVAYTRASKKLKIVV